MWLFLLVLVLFFWLAYSYFSHQSRVAVRKQGVRALENLKQQGGVQFLDESDSDSESESDHGPPRTHVGKHHRM